MKPKNFDIRNTGWRRELPQPIFDECPAYLDFYQRAWELAHDHVKAIPGMPQTPYMDEAFLDSDIWIWDSCFMMFFCKYAANVFPGIETLNNFYQPLYDGVPLPKIVTRNPPDWSGCHDGETVPVRIHISDNPPLFAWAEYSYALMTGDRAHLERLLLEKQYLQKHFAFFDSLTEPGVQTPFTRARTCLVKRENGYFWEGGRSGMDNTPRGRTGRRAETERPNHPRMLWVDAIAQQGLAAHRIARIAELIDRPELAAEWQGKFEAIKAKLNCHYWDDADGIYYDINGDTQEKIKCLTPASFWPLLSGIPAPEAVDRMCRYLTGPAKLGGPVPWVTVARDDADFNAETGDYWRGSIWLPTAYMGIKGLENYGKFDLANATARRILDHMYRTYRDYEPHTVWECYHPNLPEPAQHGTELVRPDFCGWSALGPIALFLENVIGIYQANAFTDTIDWALPPRIAGRLGIANYSFGDTVTELVYQDGRIRTSSNRPYRLNVAGRTLPVPAGEAQFTVV